MGKFQEIMSFGSRIFRVVRGNKTYTKMTFSIGKSNGQHSCRNTPVILVLYWRISDTFKARLIYFLYFRGKWANQSRRFREIKTKKESKKLLFRGFVLGCIFLIIKR